MEQNQQPNSLSTLNEQINRIQEKVLSKPRCPKCGGVFPLGHTGDCPYCRQEDELKESQKKAIFDRKNNPEKYMKKIGIGKRYLPCSLENFKGGEKYTVFCKQWLENPTESLFLTGAFGCGKTHLAVGLCRGLIQKENPIEIIFTHAIDLLYKIRQSFNATNFQDSMDNLVENYSKRDLLFLDDLGAEKSTEWAIETLSLIIDRRDREMLPTIITSNLSLEEIAEKLSGRISSRMANGKIIKINMLDYRTKR